MKHSDTGTGWIKRRFEKIEAQLREGSAAKKLQAATIGRGGLTVKDGGTLTARFPDAFGAARAVWFGPVAAVESDAGDAIGVQVDDETGRHIFQALRQYPSTDYPTGQRAVAVEADVFVVVGGDNPSIYNRDFSCFVSVGSGPDKAVAIKGGAGGVRITHSTTGASANCFVDPSDSRIWRSASSRRYKQDIDDAKIDPAAVLKLRPRTWRDRGEVETDPGTDRRYVGFIAEELHDARLRQFVIYDTEGRPEAIAYDRLSAALVVLAQDQEQRLNNLEQRIKALEASR